MLKEPGYIQISPDHILMLRNVSPTAFKLSFLIARDMKRHEADMYKNYKIKLAKELFVKLGTIEKCIKELRDAEVLIKTQWRGFFKVNAKLFGTTHR